VASSHDRFVFVAPETGVLIVEADEVRASQQHTQCGRHKIIVANRYAVQRENMPVSKEASDRWGLTAGRKELNFLVADVKS
jgi:hypothetical protein